MMIALPVVALLSLGAPKERQLVDRVVAVVNDDVITLSELEVAAQPFQESNPGPEKKTALMKDVLEQLIADKLISQQVREAKIQVTSDDVERAMEDICRQNKITREELVQAIETRGMTMARYKEDLERQLVRLKVIDFKVRARVVIPEADIKAEYEKQAALEKRDELVHLRHIFFRWGESPDPAEHNRVLMRAKAAKARVVGGDDFAAVAKEISEGPTASSGGDLGEMTKQGLLPELLRAMSGLKVGEVSDPIETPNGVHVIRVEEIKVKEAHSYEEMKPRIHQALYQQEVERQMKIWVGELRAQSAVDVRL